MSCARTSTTAPRAAGDRTSSRTSCPGSRRRSPRPSSFRTSRTRSRCRWRGGRPRAPTTARSCNGKGDGRARALVSITSRSTSVAGWSPVFASTTGARDARLPRSAPGITLDKVTAIDVEHATARALLEERTVICAGYNGKGQLGDGGSHRRTRDVRSRERSARRRADPLGIEHACASRRRHGEVLGSRMGAGNGDGIQDLPPVAGLKDVVDIDAGGSASRAASVVARSRLGPLRLRLGHGRARTPVEVPWLRGVTSLALGMFHSCAVGAGGEVLCWARTRTASSATVRTTHAVSPRPCAGGRPKGRSSIAPGGHTSRRSP